MAMSQNARFAFDRMITAGYSPVMASGIVGNLMSESTPDLNPNAWNEVEKAYGIGQWRNDRYNNLANFGAGKNPKGIGDVGIQTDFLMHELQSNYGGLFRKLLNSKSPEEVAELFDKEYERSDGSTIDQRKKDARMIFDLITKEKEEQAMAMQNQNKQGLLAQLVGKTQQPNFMGNLAVGLNSMRLDPDPNLASFINQRQERNLAANQRNRTADILDKMGHTDYASLVRAGQMSGKDVFTMLNPKDPAAVRTYKWAIANGMIPEGTSFLEFSKIQAGLNPQSAWDTAITEGEIEQYKKYEEANNNSFGELESLNVLEELAKDPDNTQGFGANVITDLKKIGQKLGYKVEGIDKAEAFTAEASKAVLAMMGGSLGAGFSDGDRSFVEKMQPKLTNTRQGNLLIIDINRFALIRRQQVFKMAQEFQRRNGNLNGFTQKLQEWADKPENSIKTYLKTRGVPTI
tara:strand:+ start:2997 stop:4376 length:1380 start_codon:yes stop_codon:yes gene_type:complete